MPRVGQKLMHCPECGKKGVSLRLDGDPMYACRYCTWDIFTDLRREDDRDALDALNARNPDNVVTL